MISLETMKFTMKIERVLLFQHSLVQAGITLHYLNLFLFTIFYLAMCDTDLYKTRSQGL